MKVSKADDAVKLNAAESELMGSYYTQTHNLLFQYANSSFRDESLAEEAVQEVFRRACEKMALFMASPNQTGWLFITLKNIMREMSYERKRLAELVNRALTLNDDCSGLTTFDEDKAVVRIHYAGLLDDKDFALLCRIAIDKYSMLEAAEEFGITVEVCKKRVQRKSKQLAERLRNL